MPITASKNYICLPPHSNVCAGKTVTSTAGTPDADYPLSYLTDERPAFPIRYPSGGWGVSIALGGATNVQLVVLANSSIDATVTVTGLGTITAGVAGQNSIRKNPFLLLNAVGSVSALALSGTNTAAMLLGEALAGVPFELTPLKLVDAAHSFLDLGEAPQGQWMNVPMHDDGLEARVLSGTQVYDQASLNNLIAWRESQRTFQRPGVLIVDPTVNDARLVMLSAFTYKYNDKKDLYDVSLTFTEWPRNRW